MKNYREVKIGPYSAYAIAKKNGFEGTEEEWLESLKPPAVDPTLSEEGKAADAKVTGDELARKAVIDDTTVGTDAWSAKHLVDMLCPPISETGNPMVCYPVAGYPLGCKVSWEPTQEGEGTPYPAGGGPNLLDISQCTATVGKPYGVTITIDGDVFKVSGVPSSEVTEEGQYSFAVASCTQTELRGKGYKITPFALKGNVSSAWGLRTEDEDSLAIAAKLTPGVNTDIQLRLMVSKDTPAAYAPYENIRPIKGRDRVTVTRFGTNLSRISDVSTPNKSLIAVELPTEIVADVEISFDTLNAEIKNLGTMLFMNRADGKWQAITVQKFGISTAGKIPNGRKTAVFRGVTFKTVETVVVKRGYCGWSGDVNNFCVSIVPNTTYAPYTGQTATLTLPRTIYGGTVDAVTGDGQETWKPVTLDGTENWEAQQTSIPGKFGFTLEMPGIATPEGPGIKGDIVCNQYPAVTANDTYRCKNGISVEAQKNYYFRIYNDTHAGETADEWKSYLAAQYAAGTPVQIAYKMATPEPFTATGAQPIPALSGVNTVMTDADALTVTGRADPIKRITDLEDAVASMTNT